MSIYRARLRRDAHSDEVRTELIGLFLHRAFGAMATVTSCKDHHATNDVSPN
jgi:hypothetical protein